MLKKASGWVQLPWAIKAIILVLPLILLGYLFTEKTVFKNKPAESLQQEGPKVGGVENGNSDSLTNNTVSPIRSFNFQPEKPVNGELKGVVEIGATGFNSFIVNVDKQMRWEIRTKNFGRPLIYEGMAVDEGVRTGLKKYIADMFYKGVQPKNVHFVISSGALKEPKTAIISSELKKMGYVVNMVSAEQEGKLALKCALPITYAANAFVVDIGSGNTKISWMSGDDIIALEAPGSKYFEKELKDDEVYNTVKANALKIPAANREVCFIIGGVPFEMANQHRQGEERYTVLKMPKEYSADKPKMKCGLNIYKAIVDATGCDTFVFDWDANFSIGFLLNLK